eukprot:gene19913-biopygen7019
MINRKCHQLHRSCRHTVCHTVLQVPWGNRKVARAWRGRGAGHRHFFWLGWRGRDAGMARAWRGHFLSPLPGTTLCMVHGDSRSGQTHVSACDRPQNSKSEAPKRESTARGTIVHTQLAALQRGPRRCAAPPPPPPRRVRLGDGPDHGEREKSRAITGTVFFSRATMVFHRGHNQTYQITGNHGNFTGTITGTITGSPNHYTGRELFFKLIIWNTPQFGRHPWSLANNPSHPSACLWPSRESSAPLYSHALRATGMRTPKARPTSRTGSARAAPWRGSAVHEASFPPIGTARKIGGRFFADFSPPLEKLSG